MIITKKQCFLYLIVMLAILLISLPCYANVKLFGKIETLSIVEEGNSIIVNIPENFSFVLPAYEEYYVQERNERMDMPIIHIFGMASNGVADFELVVNAFDLATADSTLLDQIGVNFYILGEDTNVVESTPIQVGDLSGFSLIISNLNYNGVETSGNTNVVLLANETKCICLLLIERQRNQEFYTEILTEIVSTIKM
jgi:hypothetical protein